MPAAADDPTRSVVAMGDVATELARITERIRNWREEAGLTLQELGQRSGVATSTIQKIETAQMIPSVAVLLKVAWGLGRRPAELIQEGSLEPDAIHLRAAQRHPVGVPGRMLVERLTGDLSDPALEMWRINLHPGQSSGTIRYEGEEAVICEKGSVRFRVGERSFLLRAGDSLHLKAHIPHSWTNEANGPARFLIVGTLPHEFRTQLQERLSSESTAARRD